MAPNWSMHCRSHVGDQHGIGVATLLRLSAEIKAILQSTRHQWTASGTRLARPDTETVIKRGYFVMRNVGSTERFVRLASESPRPSRRQERLAGRVRRANTLATAGFTTG
jgi:hypothetical protein